MADAIRRSSERGAIRSWTASTAISRPFRLSAAGLFRRPIAARAAWRWRFP